MQKLVYILSFFSVFSFSQEKLTHKVYFETGNFEVLPTEENRLLLFISELDGVAIDKIAIYGFCDDRGSENYNLELSQNRANAIKTIFSNNEIDESLISNVDGKGEILLKIIKDKNIDKIRGLNRKVEIIVSTKPLETKEPEPVEQEIVEKKPDNKPTNIKSLNDLASGNIKKGDKIRLQNLYFKTGYPYLLPKSKPVLEEIANLLIKNNHLFFSIEGHVCCTQNARDAINRKTNQRNLSLARAKYIYEYLLKKGINKRRMRYVGMRRKFPLGGKPEFDRRVEILITYVGKTPN